MKGVGRSIREEKERSYRLHCWDILVLLFRVDQWDWEGWVKDWKDAIGSLICVLLAICCLALFPIVVPWAGYCRKRTAAKQWDEWERYKNRVLRKNTEKG